MKLTRVTKKIAKILFSFVISSSAIAIDLERGLELVRSNAVELKILTDQLEKGKSQEKKVDAILDSYLGLQSSFTSDKNRKNLSQYDSLMMKSYDLSWQKINSYGSQYKIGVFHNFTQIDGLESLQGASGPSGASSQNSSGKTSYESGLEVEFRQALWRNWLGRELKIQKDLSRAELIQPKYQYFDLEQKVQAHTEVLFIYLSNLREKIRLSQQMKKLSEKFYSLMVKRAAYGRADPLDVADAKAKVVDATGGLLKLQLALKNQEDLLSFHIFPQGNRIGEAFESLDLKKTLGSLPASSYVETVKVALSSRQDLKLLQELKKPWKKRVELELEKNRARVDFFAKARFNGLDSDFDRSFSDIFSDKKGIGNPQITIGIMIEKPLGATMHRATEEEQRWSLQELDHKSMQMTAKVKEDVKMAWNDKEAAEKLLSQAQDHERSILALLKEEQKRISQARSDSIAAIRYEMDIVAARMEEVASLSQSRESEASIKLLCHAYPMEKMR